LQLQNFDLDRKLGEEQNPCRRGGRPAQNPFKDTSSQSEF
jgi:hypothetical protein